MIKGIHHITSITSSAKKTSEFYTQVLGLKLIKKTVNFDSPETYHLYFGNVSGDPGTALTFFPFKGIQKGYVGTGQVTITQFSIPLGAIPFWQKRFEKNEIEHATINNELHFKDFDGLKYALVEDKNKEIAPFTDIISKQYAIKGFYGAVLEVDECALSDDVITKVLNYKKTNSKELTSTYIASKEHGSNLVLKCSPNEPLGMPGSGTVHHIAFRVKDEDAQEDLRKKIIEFGLHPTPVIDRKYFKSVYFREPGGILYEIATNGPGFTIDESVEELGTNLMLPEQYEPYREQLTVILGDL